MKKGQRVFAVNLPEFFGILSHFTQPGKIFADEIFDRLKVIACLETPFMIHSEELEPQLDEKDHDRIRTLLKAGKNDAHILFWGPPEDIDTALETIEERCIMALEGVPNETRKSFENGTTIFERVLPGADRMYPDTDTAPLPLDNEYIEALKKDLPEDIIDRYRQLQSWNIPEDTYTYIFSRNHYPLIEKLISGLNMDPVFAGTFIGHTFKSVAGQYKIPDINFEEIIYNLFKFLKTTKLNNELAEYMIPVIYEHPKMDFESVLDSIKFKKNTKNEIISLIPFLKKKFKDTAGVITPKNEINWIMGELRLKAAGNIELKELAEHVKK